MKDKVERDLFKLQDLKYQQFQLKLCPGVSNIIGVRVPELRKYAKGLLKDNYIIYLNNPNDKYFETIMLEGMLIAYSKINIKDKFSYLDNFVPKIDNWAICDTVCSSFKLKEKELNDMWNYLIKYKKSKDEYSLRFMLVMFLNYYLNEEYLDKVIKIIDDIYTGDYYIDMAIAWLLSYVFVKDKDKFMVYLGDNNLSKDIWKKTFRKIIESKQVTSEEKDYIRKISKNF